LVRRARAPKDAQLFERFFGDNYQAVCSGLYLIVRDHDLAQEATEEAFARAWLKWHRVQDMNRPRAWVSKVALHEALRLKKRAMSAVAADEGKVQEDWTRIVHVQDHVRALLRELSPQQRAVIVSRYYFDLSIEQTASELRIAEGSVKRHCADALVRLEKAWESAEAQPSKLHEESIQ
jgi:RNA polymerase sigma factor (sigma-70 family)